MRQKRAKQYRRLLQQYQLHFGFRTPVQLLIDDALVLHFAKENATPLSASSPSHGRWPPPSKTSSGGHASSSSSPLSRLATVLQQPADGHHVKILITQCAMVALYNRELKAREALKALQGGGATASNGGSAPPSSTTNSSGSASAGGGGGSSKEKGKDKDKPADPRAKAAAALSLAQRAIALAKDFERRRCNHRDALDPETCVRETIGAPTNRHRYVLGTARLQLRVGAVGRETVGLPVLHPNETGVLVMAPMNEPTRARVEELEKAALAGPATTPLPDNVITGPAPTTTSAAATTPSSSPPSQPAPTIIHRKRKAKGPNPLSVKKKKKAKPNAPANKQGARTVAASGGGAAA